MNDYVLYCMSQHGVGLRTVSYSVKSENFLKMQIDWHSAELNVTEKSEFALYDIDKSFAGINFVFAGLSLPWKWVQYYIFFKYR